MNNNYGMTPEQASREFDALRREATKLERALEEKLARYQQLAQRITVGDPSTSEYEQRSSLLDVEAGVGTRKGFSKKDTSMEEEEAVLSADIQRTISTMTDLLNTRMAPAAERTGRSQHSLLVKRYREILFDCGERLQEDERGGAAQARGAGAVREQRGPVRVVPRPGHGAALAAAEGAQRGREFHAGRELGPEPGRQHPDRVEESRRQPEGGYWDHGADRRQHSRGGRAHRKDPREEA